MSILMIGYCGGHVKVNNDRLESYTTSREREEAHEIQPDPLSPHLEVPPQLIPLLVHPLCIPQRL
jgi:hypothetical protein